MWRTDANGSNRQRVLATASATSPAVSAAGDLAFIESFDQVTLKRIDWDESSPPTTQTLLESTRTAYDPQWSANGEHLAFYSNRSGAMEIWTCNADGSNLRQLTFFGGGYTRNPRWSPDGQHIAFDSTSPHQPAIFIVPGAGGSPRKVTDGGSADLIPAWSSDGAFLYFTSLRTGAPQIWKAPVHGGDAVQVTFFGGLFPSVSTDGYVHFVRAPGSRTLLRIPETGGQEEVVLADALGYQSWWALAQTGVAYVDRERALRFYSAKTRQATAPLARFKHRELSPATTITVTRDGHSIVCPVITRQLSDVMVLRDFFSP